jgi:membrane protein implicated in regulation of membrane protease activity
MKGSKMLKSKTMWFSAILAALSVAQGFVFQLPMSPELQGLVGAVVAAIVAYLRTQTTQPLSQKPAQMSE